MIYVHIHLSDQNNFARVTSEQKQASYKLDLGTTCQKDLVFLRSDFLRLVGAQYEYVRLTIIQYMFQYSCRIKTTLLESLRSQKSPIKARFR